MTAIVATLILSDVQKSDSSPLVVQIKSKESIYCGTVSKDNQPHGHGKIEYISGPNKGVVYVGDFCQGEKHGEGVFTFPTKSIFAAHKGTFYHDQMTGEGIRTWKHNADQFTGMFVNDICTSGVLHCANSDTYMGENSDLFEAEGHGVMAYANGDKFEGQFRWGKPIGEGFIC